jgi:hypothetical protein
MLKEKEPRKFIQELQQTLHRDEKGFHGISDEENVKSSPSPLSNPQRFWMTSSQTD